MKFWMTAAAIVTSALLLGGAAANSARAHGEAAPQPVDTAGLDPLGEDWRTENPYRGNATAVKIGMGESFFSKA